MLKSSKELLVHGNVLGIGLEDCRGQGALEVRGVLNPSLLEYETYFKQGLPWINEHRERVLENSPEL